MKQMMHLGFSFYSQKFYSWNIHHQEDIYKIKDIRYHFSRSRWFSEKRKLKKEKKKNNLGGLWPFSSSFNWTLCSESSSLTVWDRIIPNSFSPILSPYDSWPVAALAGVVIDQAGLAVMQVGVSVQALEKRGLISYILIQAIGATAAKVC